MKTSEIEIIYKMFDKIPKSLSISLQFQILKNKKVLESEISLIEKVKKNVYLEEYIEYVNKYKSFEDNKDENFEDNVKKLYEKFADVINIQKTRMAEFESYMKKDFEDSDKLFYISIDDLPDDINNLDDEFLSGLMLITK